MTISSRKLPSEETTNRHVESSPSWVPVPENTVCLVECRVRAASIRDSTSSAISGRMWGPCNTPTTNGEEDWAVELACVAWVERDARRLALPRPLRGAAQAPIRVVRVIAMHMQLADIDIGIDIEYDVSPSLE